MVSCPIRSTVREVLKENVFDRNHTYVVFEVTGQSVLELLCWHIHLSPCGWRPSLWAVIGRRDEARGVAYVAMTLHYLWQGSWGERWEGPSRHYKETDARPQASCRALPYRSNVQPCLCLQRRGRKSIQTGGPEYLSRFFEQLAFSLWETIPKQLYQTESSIKEQDCGGEGLLW